MRAHRKNTDCDLSVAGSDSTRRLADVPRRHNAQRINSEWWGEQTHAGMELLHRKSSLRIACRAQWHGLYRLACKNAHSAGYTHRQKGLADTSQRCFL